jgi:hypothetical protein
MAEHHVFLIFGDFDGDLWSLSRDQHVWLMDSPANDAEATRVWNRDSEPYTPLHGVTTFECAGASPTELFRILVTVDGHHDDSSVDDPWTAIHVRGMAMEGTTSERLSSELGFLCRVLPEDGGFVIIRAAQLDAAADDSRDHATKRSNPSRAPRR